MFFFCEMCRFAKLRLKCTLFQENHVFTLQNSNLEQNIDSEITFVLLIMLILANFTIFALKSFFCEMYRFATLRLIYTLFQENHVFPLQNRDFEQKVESDNAFVL